MKSLHINRSKDKTFEADGFEISFEIFKYFFSLYIDKQKNIPFSIGLDIFNLR